MCSTSDRGVVGVHRKRPGGCCRPARLDVAFVVGTRSAGQQDDASSFADYHRNGVAAGVAGVVPHHDQLAPRAAVVRRTAHDQVDVAPVVRAVASRFGEGQQRAVGGADERRMRKQDEA